ncbi:MAG: PP2C family protein-serine/threonine phosphatase [Eubacteriales bacterium]|nr:MAG: hypothetical protein CVV03_02985 [Firmicutes bacterium HGW-Firmicutes-8]
MDKFEPQEYKALYNISLLMADHISDETFEQVATTIVTQMDLLGCSIWKKKQGFKGIMRLGYYEVGSDGSLPNIDYQVAEQVINTGQPWSKNWFEETGSLTGGKGVNGMAFPLGEGTEPIGALCLWFSKDQNSEVSRILAKELAAQVSRGVAQVLQVNEQQEQPVQIGEVQVLTLNRSSNLPRLEGISLAARSVSRRQERADFYDFLPSDQSRLVFILGDTMNQGIASSIVQFTTRMVFRAVARRQMGPGKILSRINEVLCPELGNQGMIIGMTCGIYNPQTGLFHLANAGYNDPVIFSGRDCTFKKPKEAGPFLGLTDNMAYDSHSLKLNNGDIVVFYSDGLLEAMNDSGELYGRARLNATIDKYRLYDAPSLLDFLFLDIGNFLGGRRQLDDITLIVIKVG